MYDDIEEGFTLKEILHKHRHKALNIMHCVEKAAKILNNCSAIDKLILKKRRRDELLLKIERCEELIRTTVDENYEPTWKEIIDIRDLDVFKRSLKPFLLTLKIPNVGVFNNHPLFFPLLTFFSRRWTVILAVHPYFC